MNEVWRVQSFEVVRYAKDGVDKGYVLRSTEAVMLIVEEMSLNLQGMTSSRFVSAFLDEVNSWARCLGNIGSVVEVWMQVKFRSEMIHLITDEIILSPSPFLTNHFHKPYSNHPNFQKSCYVLTFELLFFLKHA